MVDLKAYNHNDFKNMQLWWNKKHSTLMILKI